MHRFLVCSDHTGREPPASYIIEAASAQEIEEQYPIFTARPIYRLPDERPAWLTDEYLALIERGSMHRLGEKESPMLTVLLDHLAKGDTWRWYALEQRLEGAEPISHGELGTFRRLGKGSDLGALPRKPGRWHVVSVEPPPDPGVTAKLVIAPTETG